MSIYNQSSLKNFLDLHKPMIIRMSCSFCEESFAECTSFGKDHYMCIECEQKITDRLKLILKFE